MPIAQRPLVHPRDELVATMQRIYRYKMTTTSGGNLSIRDETGAVWITPARVDKGRLAASDIVCIGADGKPAGRHPPSSEYPFHEAIYRVRPDLGAVIHAHPVALVAFSICRTIPRPDLFPQAAHVCRVVNYAPYELPGSRALGENIAAVFATGCDCAMLENHGVVVGGRDLAEAFQRFETLEFTAKTVIKASQLGPVRYLTPEQLTVAERPRGPAGRASQGELPEFVPPAASTREKEIRQELCEFIQRGYRQRLLISTGGSFSARLTGDDFVISSYGVDRQSIQPGELTLIHAGQREAGHHPSRAVRIHQRLYREYPSVQAIVNATPVNATAFSVSSTTLDARTIPESYLFLGDVPTAPFNAAYGDGATLTAVLSPSRPVALLENNGAMILGKSILDAFDRLEVLECTAEAVINSLPLGPLRPMTEGQIEQLRTTFGML